MTNGFTIPNFGNLFHVLWKPLTAWRRRSESRPQPEAAEEFEEDHAEQEAAAAEAAEDEPSVPDLTTFRKNVGQSVRETGATSLPETVIEELAESWAETLPPDPPNASGESFSLSFLQKRIEDNQEEIEQLEQLDRENEDQRRDALPVGERAYSPLAYKLIATGAASIAFAPTLAAVGVRMTGDGIIGGVLGLLGALVASGLLTQTLLDEQADQAEGLNGFILTAGFGGAFAALRLDYGSGWIETLAYLGIEVTVLGLILLYGRRRRANNAKSKQADLEHEVFDRRADWIADQIDFRQELIDEDLAAITAEQERREAEAAARQGLQARGKKIARGAILQALAQNKSDAERPRHQVVLDRIRQSHAKENTHGNSHHAH